MSVNVALAKTLFADRRELRELREWKANAETTLEEDNRYIERLEESISVARSEMRVVEGIDWDILNGRPLDDALEERSAALSGVSEALDRGMNAKGMGVES